MIFQVHQRRTVFLLYLDVLMSAKIISFINYIQINNICNSTFIIEISLSKSCKHEFKALVFNFFTATNCGSVSLSRSKIPL